MSANPKIRFCIHQPTTREENEEEGEAVVVDEEREGGERLKKRKTFEDETKKMTLDVSDASTSEGFDFSAGLDTVKATEENEDKRISDTELAAIEKEEDAKEKELESEDEMQKERKEKYDVAVALNSEDNTQITSKKKKLPSSEEEEKLVFHDVEKTTIEAEVTKGKQSCGRSRTNPGKEDEAADGFRWRNRRVREKWDASSSE